MDYKIVLMKHAEEDLDRFIAYLLFEKKSEQAARNLLNDFEATKTSLSNVAGSLKLCDNLKLKELGYRRISGGLCLLSGKKCMQFLQMCIKIRNPQIIQFLVQLFIARVSTHF